MSDAVTTTDSSSTIHAMTVRLSGHLIDSLTLTKVIDLILKAGGSYELNKLEVARDKNDISVAILTVTAASPDALKALADQLKPYGAEHLKHSPYQTARCQQDGQLPDEVFIYPLAETQVKGPAGWVKISNSQCPLVLKVLECGPDEAVVLIPVSQVRCGDLLIVGKPGIKLF